MTIPSYSILAALIEGPLHGYAILKRVEDLSGARLRMSTGTLYGALERLSAEGLLRDQGEARMSRPIQTTGVPFSR
jgi:DNA-binding PadR family transcriptional regulator